MEKISIHNVPFMMPTPTVLVGANVKGKPNFMTVGWTGFTNISPPMLTVAIGQKKYTNLGILENNTFSVNVPNTKQMVVTDYCGIVSGSKVDKSALFEIFYGKLGTAPMIKDFPVNMECKLFKSIDLPNRTLHIAEIMDVFIDKECMTEDRPDIKKIDPIILTFPKWMYYSMGDVIGRGFFIGKEYKKNSEEAPVIAQK
ncbi:MAG TPA: flavin reductase family protein [Methanocella sp.]|uniref:flavin reductase family protein n=1 Tax=Methanocella sp. TaxID=2052833 RepID=UPI002D19A76F|nr:flavin reductase family protein [Methanocella sp.]HTY90372.1 flavin reductase family protein [Methanocella sp.]